MGGGWFLKVALLIDSFFYITIYQKDIQDQDFHQLRGFVYITVHKQVEMQLYKELFKWKFACRGRG